jgi:uncharacterized protein YkwD
MLPPYTQKRKRLPKSLVSVFWLVGLVIAMPQCAKFTQQQTVKQERTAFQQVNYLREKQGRNPLVWDDRVYRLAKARVRDMLQHNYYDHTNPKTGDCPDKIKAAHGLQPDEYVAENINGYDANSAQFRVSPTQSVQSWNLSRGHRFNLLYANHTAGAIACESSKCVFLGYNRDRFGQGCHTAAEGKAHWATAPMQPNEVQVPNLY